MFVLWDLKEKYTSQNKTNIIKEHPFRHITQRALQNTGLASMDRNKKIEKTSMCSKQVVKTIG